MIKSMTGFGRAQAENDALRLTIEISCVNRKQLDCNLSLPRDWLVLEAPLQSLIRRYCVRGYLKVNFVAESLDHSHLTESVRQQFALLTKLADELKLTNDFTASSLLQCPNLTHGAPLPEPTDALEKFVAQTLTEALEALNQMRCREGALLESDLRKRFQELAEIRATIATRAPEVPRHYQTLLKARLEALLADKTSLDSGTLERELAVFADRCDVSEELTRLAAHLQHAEELLSRNEPCGRSLDFLCQELYREINTTGSKANDTMITSQVIAFKAKLETIREQVQNVE